MWSQNAHKYCSFKKHPELFLNTGKSIPTNKVPCREYTLSESYNGMSKMKTRITIYIYILKGETWRLAETEKEVKFVKQFSICC